MGRMPPKSSQRIKPGAGKETTPPPSVPTRRVTRNSPVKAKAVTKPPPRSVPARRVTRNTPNSPAKANGASPPANKAKFYRSGKEVDPPPPGSSSGDSGDDQILDDNRHRETNPPKDSSGEISDDNQEINPPKELSGHTSDDNQEINTPKALSGHISDDNQEINPPKELKQEEELLNEGRNIFALMKPEEVEEMLERIDKLCSPLDTVNSRKRELSTDWEKVSFSSYGPHQCQAAWTFLRHHARKIRILSEVVQEVKMKLSENKAFYTKLIESLPGFPQKPPNTLGGFHYFNRELWEQLKSEQPTDLPNYVKFQRECKEKWNKLTSPEKGKYEEKADLALAEYKRQVKEFYAKNPGLSDRINKIQVEQNKRKRSLDKISKKSRRTAAGASKSRTKIIKAKATKTKSKIDKIKTLPNPYEDAPQVPQSPLILFIQSKLNRLSTPPTAEELPGLKNKFFEKFKNLKDSKRAKWVDVCLKECQRYLDDVSDYQQHHPEYLPTRPLKLRSICSKEDIALWSTANGFPASPKYSVFDLFYEEYLESDENADCPEEERRKIALSKWNEMDWYHKEMYKMKYKISIVEYKKQIQTFFSNQPEFLKPSLYPQVPKKFLKLVNEVDKVNEADGSLINFEGRDANLTDGDHEFHEHEDEVMEMGDRERLGTEEESREAMDDEEPVRKKRKKDKKKKHRDQDSALKNSEEDASLKYEEEEYIHFDKHPEVTYAQMEVEEPEKLVHSPKKKKKKKHRDLDDGEPETITGDIYSDSYSESQTDHGENQVGSSKKAKPRKSSSVYGIEEKKQAPPAKKSKGQRGYKNKQDQLQEHVSAEVEKMKSAWHKPVQVIEEDFLLKKPSSKHFTSENVIVQQDIFEAIRGIFDGRPHVGKRWSLYYYYAKYVSCEKVWIDSVNAEGLEKTALKIINLFLSLNSFQKDTFIEQVYSTHLRNNMYLNQKGKISLGAKPAYDYFPGEPIRPPRFASALYRADMEKRKRENPGFTYPPLFSPEIDPNTRIYYIKRLYHETRIYMKQYDKFISRLTPYEMVDYACLKARRFEEEAYRQQTISNAVKGFIFPLVNISEELDDAGIESEPEILRQRKPTGSAVRMRSKRYRTSANPFAEDNAKPKTNSAWVERHKRRTQIKQWRAGELCKTRKVIVTKLKRKRRVKKQKRRKRSVKPVNQLKKGSDDADSDDPSDNEELGFRLGYDISLYNNNIDGKRQIRKCQAFNFKKIKRAAKYTYPMDDIYRKIQMANSKVNDVSTQTKSAKFRAKKTQTLGVKSVDAERKINQILSNANDPRDHRELMKTPYLKNSSKRKATSDLDNKNTCKKPKTSLAKKLPSKSSKKVKPRISCTPVEPLDIELSAEQLSKRMRDRERLQCKTSALRKKFLANTFSTIACDVVLHKKGRRVVKSKLGKNIKSKLREEIIAKYAKPAQPMTKDNSEHQQVIDSQLVDQCSQNIGAVQGDQEVMAYTNSEVVFPSSSDVIKVPGIYDEDNIHLPMSQYDFEMPEPLQPLAVIEESEMAPDVETESPQFTVLTVVNQL